MALGCSGSPDYTLKVINVVTPPLSMGKFSINGYQFGAHDLLVFRGEGAIEVSAATRFLSTYPEYKYSKQLKENRLIDTLRDFGFFRLVDVPELSEEVLSMRC